MPPRRAGHTPMLALVRNPDIVEMCHESGDEVDVDVVGLYAKLGLGLLGR